MVIPAITRYLFYSHMYTLILLCRFDFIFVLCVCVCGFWFEVSSIKYYYCLIVSIKNDIKNILLITFRLGFRGEVDSNEFHAYCISLAK